MDNFLLIQQSLQQQILGYRSVFPDRSNRSLLPFVGSTLSFLFGTVSEGDLNTIRTHLRRLRYNQPILNHVLYIGLLSGQSGRTNIELVMGELKDGLSSLSSRLNFLS